MARTLPWTQQPKRDYSERDNPRNSRQWRNLRAWHITQEPWCRVCRKKDVLTEAVEVDHIIPLSEGGQLLDPANLQSLCRPCHQKKSAEEDRQRRKRKQ